MVAADDHCIYLLDSSGYPSVLDLETFITEPITDRKASSFQFFDGIGYYSDTEGNVYRMIPADRSEQQAPVRNRPDFSVSMRSAYSPSVRPTAQRTSTSTTVTL